MQEYQPDAFLGTLRWCPKNDARAGTVVHSSRAAEASMLVVGRR